MDRLQIDKIQNKKKKEEEKFEFAFLRLLLAPLALLFFTDSFLLP